MEEFLDGFGRQMSALTEEAFRTQVTALVKLKECEDAHLGEEVDRNWLEVLSQQYVFDRLGREVSASARSATTPTAQNRFAEGVGLSDNAGTKRNVYELRVRLNIKHFSAPMKRCWGVSEGAGLRGGRGNAGKRMCVWSGRGGFWEALSCGLPVCGM